MKFRPCIDLHNGLVKQIVGLTLSDASSDAVKTNYTTDKSPAWFADLYRSDYLVGGHVIKLGPGNDSAASEALEAWPGGMQIGGGITAENAGEWIDRGASHVIVTSYVFTNGRIDEERLAKLVKAVGRERIVLDLSCRKKGEEYYIVTDRWQNFTSVTINARLLESLAESADEFLIHAADVEGKCAGVEVQLVKKLGVWSPIPATYAGGIRDIGDLQVIKDAGKGRLDITIGSGLDIFGGTTITYRDAVVFCGKGERSL